ncbi:MAG: prolipoprotein diacylglyceryl transferase [Candidatus Margulisbacteria bacterium]|nr:prolipoprotein diacylglyceryl transferase [Candidatus Margulisiibacteriota bacterium]
MYPILFKIGPFAVHAYGFMVAIAFIVGIMIALYLARREGIASEAILDMAIYVIIAAIVGARLMYVIGEWQSYRDNLIEIFMVQKGGLAFLGGLILAIIVVIWQAKMKKIPLLKLLDIGTPVTALGYAIARIGCFLNGCCFGHPTKLPWGVVFPPGSLAYFQYPDTPIHPTQLYALCSMLIVFVLTLNLWKHKKYDGQVFFWGLILYATYRFIVEFFRYCPAELYWLGLNPGQIISLLMFVGGVVGLSLMHKRFQTGV